MVDQKKINENALIDLAKRTGSFSISPDRVAVPTDSGELYLNKEQYAEWLAFQYTKSKG